MPKEWRCNCGKETDTKKQLIAHYRDVHPEGAYECYDQIGTVGDAFMDHAIEQARREVAQARQREARTSDYDALVKRYNALARAFEIVSLQIEQASALLK